MPDLPASFQKGIPCLCIDASSMIYHLKMGLLSSLGAEVRLISTPPVIAEVGWPHLPVTEYHLENAGELTNDQSLLALAEREGVPVLSEDKEILETAAHEGMGYYNSLMMLNYLLLKGRVRPQEYEEYLNRLIECSRYSQAVLDYGRAVYESVTAQLEMKDKD